MTVAELLSRMTAIEFAEWMAFYKLEPFGTDIDMLGHAITASTTYNVNRGKGRPLKPQDFMPDFEKEAKPKTVEDMISQVKMLNKIFKGKENDR
jgi:hypothetical protein